MELAFAVALITNNLRFVLPSMHPLMKSALALAVTIGLVQIRDGALDLITVLVIWGAASVVHKFVRLLSTSSDKFIIDVVRSARR